MPRPDGRPHPPRSGFTASGSGAFAVEVGKGIRPQTFILHTPIFLLGSANAMSAAEWEALAESQLQAYYKPVRDWDESPPAGADPEEFTLPGAPHRHPSSGATASRKPRNERVFDSRAIAPA